MSRARVTVTMALTICIGVAAQACSAGPPTDPQEHEVVAQSGEALTTVLCIKTLTCCVSAALAPLAWDTTDPFDNQLAAWGCSKPRLYAPNQATNAWWYWSVCTDPNKRVESFLTANAQFTAAPYLASTSTSLDLLCVPPPPSGSVDVLWDPTCTTCRVIN
jgi:hypothetical protein